MSKQQTAVEWLGKELESYGNPQFCKITWKELDLLIEQANKIFEEQIIDARQDGYESTYNSCESGCMGEQILGGNNEQYYNETFNQTT